MKQCLILIVMCGLLFPALQAKEDKVVMELVPSPQKVTKDDGKMPDGKRDPFWNLLMQPRPLIETLGALKIEELKLVGIVRMSSGEFQALFLSPKKSPFIAKEGQQLLNGKIVKITFNAVTFEKTPTVKLPKK